MFLVDECMAMAVITIHSNCYLRPLRAIPLASLNTQFTPIWYAAFMLDPLSVAKSNVVQQMFW